MIYVTYMTKNGTKREEYLDIEHLFSDRERLAYLESLFHYGHIKDLIKQDYLH